MIDTINASSIYEKCLKFREDLKIERAREAVEKGLYPGLDTAIKKTPSPNVMAVMKSIAMEKSNLAKTDPQLKIEAIKNLISDVMKITPEDFLNIWSVDNLKRYNLYTCVMGIVDAAPVELKKNCLFYPQYIFFASVWPEKIDTIVVPKLKESSVFYCKDLIKDYLLKAGNPNGGKYGKEVDDILLSSINSEMALRQFNKDYMKKLIPDLTEKEYKYLTCKFEAEGFGRAFQKDKELEESIKEKTSRAHLTEKQMEKVKDVLVDKKFEFLSELCRKNNKVEKNVGIVNVVKKRGYPSVLDFYFIKMPAKEQQKYYEDYLFYREKAGLKKEPIIDKLMVANLYAQYFSTPEEDRIREIARDLIKKGEGLSAIDVRNKSCELERRERIEYAVEEYKWMMDKIKKKIKAENPELEKKEKSKKKDRVKPEPAEEPQESDEIESR